MTELPPPRDFIAIQGTTTKHGRPSKPGRYLFWKSDDPRVEGYEVVVAADGTVEPAQFVRMEGPFTDAECEVGLFYGPGKWVPRP